MSRYWDCLERHGLDPHRGGDRELFGSRQSLTLSRQDSAAARDELTRIAVIEATCNRDTRLAQTLGDLEASYQAPLIRRNEAALLAEREAGRRVVDAARAHLADRP